jgi:hypothetical protein
MLCIYNVNTNILVQDRWLTARVSGRWEGRDSLSKREKLKAQKNVKKRGAYPPVHCTHC